MKETTKLNESFDGESRAKTSYTKPFALFLVLTLVLSSLVAFTAMGAVDNDGDGLEDSLDPDPNNVDTDGDGLTDGEEVNLYGTDPNDTDTDDDGLGDYEEVNFGDDGYITSAISEDSDGDGLTDYEEYTYGCHPWNKDTDRDGLNDYEELNIYGTDPLDIDTDKDGLTDGYEVDKTIVVLLSVAIFQDDDPWSNTCNQDILSWNGIPYTIYGSTDMGVVDISGYAKVIIPSDQDQNFYDTVSANTAYFESYASNGGVLEIHAADAAWNGGHWGTIPCGFSWAQVYGETVDIASPGHPILTTPHAITDGELDGWSNSYHGYFTAIPPSSNIILTEGNTGIDYPVLVTAPYGSGFVLASGQTLEWGWDNGYSGILENIILYHPSTTGLNVIIDSPTDTADFLVGDVIIFDASSTLVPVGETMTYVWHSDINGTLYSGSNSSFNTSSLIKGVHKITLKVISSGGMTGEASIYIAVNDAACTYTPVINSPVDGECYAMMTFNASSGASSYKWISNLDGIFGNRQIFDYVLPTHGTHMIYLIGTDAAGNSNITQVSIYNLRSMPTIPDTDNDGLTDGEEEITYGTDPTDPDSDNDWILDGEEVKVGSNGYITYANDPTWSFDSDWDDWWQNDDSDSWADDYLGISGIFEPGIDEIFTDDDWDGVYTAKADVFVDGDGTATANPGVEFTNNPGDFLTNFDSGDNVYWYDVGTIGVWDAGDELYLDLGDDDGSYDAGVDSPIIDGGSGMQAPNYAGESIELDWLSGFAYDDQNEGNGNWMYNSGEDIYFEGTISSFTYSSGADTCLYEGLFLGIDTNAGDPLYWGGWPNEEILDGIDNDLDGLIDEEYNTNDWNEIYVNGTHPENPDTDNDWLDDYGEMHSGFGYTTNVTNPDTDGDGLTDGQEIWIWGTDPTDADSDNDNLLDGVEILNDFDFGTGGMQRSNPNLIDSDGDGLNDYNEIFVHFTSPVLIDTDNDGLTDNAEVLIGSDPLLPDTDRDQLFDGFEVNVWGTNPLDVDTDNDGLWDGTWCDMNFDGVWDFWEYPGEWSLGINPLNPDTDGDGEEDGYEWFYGSTPWLLGVTVAGMFPGATDVDFDGLEDNGVTPFAPWDEPGQGTIVGNPDTDADGLDDGEEVFVYWTSPVPTGIQDSDNDGLTDGQEILVYFTNPWMWDSDGDESWLYWDNEDGDAWSDAEWNYNGLGRATYFDPGVDEVFVDNDKDRYYTTIADIFVDGDGTATTGPGTEESHNEGDWLMWFTSSDDVYWCDKDGSNDWSSGDALFLDPVTDDGWYHEAAGSVTIIGNLVDGDVGVELGTGVSPPYTYNFTFSDTNINWAYDDGEDIYFEETAWSLTYSTRADTCLYQGQTLGIDTLPGDFLFNGEESNEEIMLDGVDNDMDGLIDEEHDPYDWNEVNYGSNPRYGDTDNDNLYEYDELMDWDPLTNGTQITDILNPDTDGDGLMDGMEVGWYGSDPLIADTDGDGLSDLLEVSIGTNPTSNDTDGDMLLDYDEFWIYFTDPNNPDTDGDGLDDWQEINFALYFSDPNDWDTDNDGASDGDEAGWWTNLKDADTDNDYYSDGSDRYWFPLVGWIYTSFDIDNDYDGLLDGFEEVSLGLDMTDGDTDSDGVSDAQEVYTFFTDPNNPDTDGDGLDDGEELFNYYTDPNNPDTDSDGLSDGNEVWGWNTNPLSIDTDGDGLDDYEEINVYNTDPTSRSTDDDGLSDGSEVDTWGTDPLRVDTDGDGTWDDAEVWNDLDPLDPTIYELVDSDGDGLSDEDEAFYGTDVNDKDTDNDGLRDGFEVYTDWAVFTDGMQTTDPLVMDTDDDMLLDGDEVNSWWWLGVGSIDPIVADSDNDGLSDGKEYWTYYTMPDRADTDNDGLSDYEEVYLGVDGWITDAFNPDTDGDILLDSEESTVGTSPTNGDTDFDFIPDGYELCTYNIYSLNPLDRDTDNDGLIDGFEILGFIFFITDPNSADTDNGGAEDFYEFMVLISLMFIGDGNYTNPNDPRDDNSTLAAFPDTDGDYIPDVMEDLNGNGIFDPDEGDGIDNDGDGLIDEELWDGIDNDGDGLIDEDPRELDLNNSDPDGDGLVDGIEIIYGLVFTGDSWNVWDSDMDDDGISDYEEFYLGADGFVTDPCSNDTDGDNILDNEEINVYNTDPTNWDTDNDGMNDGDELMYGTDPTIYDTDDDGLSDGSEIWGWGTDASNADTDGDGLTDGEEAFTYGTDPTDADTDDGGIKDGDEIAQTPPLDPNNYLDDFADSDGDSISNVDEIYVWGTDIYDDDSDDDGLIDGDEVNVYGTNPLSNDTDGDNLLDALEINTYGTDPLVNDTDGDQILDGEEVVIGEDGYITNPLLTDSDGDGLDDYEEVNNGTDGYITNPNVIDTDSDGLGDYEEYTYGTNPLSNDTDADNLLDNEEINTYGTNPLVNDTDGDGLMDDEEIYGTRGYITSAIVSDSDHDGLSDYEEVYLGADGYITDPNKIDTDNDGLDDHSEYLYGTDPNNEDTDGGGVSDGAEVYILGTNPLNGEDDKPSWWATNLPWILLAILIIISMVFTFWLFRKYGGREEIIKGAEEEAIPEEMTFEEMSPVTEEEPLPEDEMGDMPPEEAEEKPKKK